MKNIFHGLFLIFISAVSLFAQNDTLRGDDAVKQLQQTGQYDSLMNAVKDARKKNGQTVEPQSEDAVGQSAKLIASDGATEDYFGTSVSVSGNTAVVGAFLDDINGGFNEGSAYIFVKVGTTWTQQAKLTASDRDVGDRFGNSVSISGDTVIVGAPLNNIPDSRDQGAAYVFVRNGTTWTQQAKLFASDGAINDFFGVSVSISGNTAIVGANNVDVGANVDQGAAYIFSRNGSVWTQQAKLTANDGAAGDGFGQNVSIDGDTAIIGASQDDVGARANQGSAYIFNLSAGVWTQQAQLIAADGATDDLFGNGVSISGDTVVIGASQDDFPTAINQGSAYIYIRSGGVWTQQQKITSSDGSANDIFGRSVSISGNTLIAGSYLDGIGANNAQGSAYVFTRSGTVWTQQQKFIAADGVLGDRFGNSVAISGDNILVGTEVDDIGANSDQGSVYVFRILGSNWTQEAQNVASDGATNDFLGNSVSISGNTAVVGASLDDVGANVDQGSAYVFVRNVGVWTQQARLNSADGAAFDQFGNSVAIYGDTIIVGAPNDGVGANASQGSAYVFTRSGTVWTQQAQLNGIGGAAGDQFGWSVAISGETAIIGAYIDDVGANNGQGAAYVFVRSGGVWTQQAQLIATDGATNDSFGFSVAISGNTTVISANGDNVGANADQGSAYVFVRNGTVWSQQAQLIATGGAADDLFGASVGISGETIIVGANNATVGANTLQGSAYIFVRSGTVWSQQAQLNSADGATGDQFGKSVAIDGDAAVVGAWFHSVGASNEQGSAYVFSRNGVVWTQQQELIATNGAATDNFGTSVSISGDKIIVGAPFSNVSVNIPFAPNAFDQGAVFTFVNNVAPTAAGVSVGGRILNADGIGIRNAVVSATLANGEVITTRSTTFGYYNFEDLEAGQTIVISVNSKRFTYTPQVIMLSDNIDELNFWAQ